MTINEYQSDTRTYVVCPKCNKYPTMMLRAVGRVESTPLQEIDPVDGWRRFKALTCKNCMSPMSLFEHKDGENGEI